MTIFDTKYVIAGGISGEIRVVNLSTGNCAYILDPHVTENVHVNYLTTLNDDLLFCGSPWIRLVSLSKLGGPDMGRIFDGHTRNVTCIDVEPTSSKWFISGGEDGNLRVWDLRAKGYQIGTKHCQGINAGGKLHTNQGAFVFGDANGFVNEWDLAGNKILRKSLVGSKPVGLGVHAMAIDHPRGNVVGSHNNREVSVFELKQLSNVNSDKINLVEETTPTSINSAATSRKFGNLIEPTQSFATDVHSSYITNVRFGNTFESLAVSSGDGSVSVWRTLDTTGNWTLDNVMKESAEEDHNTQPEWCWDALFVDQEERFVLSGHSDGVCNLWDTSRHVPTPIAAYDCGGGKAVKTMVVLDDTSINPTVIDRRHRIGK